MSPPRFSAGLKRLMNRPGPRWKRYRSSKWFELYLLQAAIVYGDYEDGPRENECPFCEMANSAGILFVNSTETKEPLDVCFFCVFGPQLDGCYNVFPDSLQSTFSKTYGSEWYEAYPDIAIAIGFLPAEWDEE